MSVRKRQEAVIKGVFPHAKSLVWHEEGQNNVIVFVDQTWVFRFPKHERGEAELKKEILFLQKYGQGLGLPVPNPHFYNIDKTKGPFYSVYRKIAGRPLTNDSPSEADREAWADALGRFLTRLHRLPLTAELLAVLGEPAALVNGWSDFFERVEKMLFPHMRPDARKRVESLCRDMLAAISKSNEPLTVIHGDFGMGNILIDPVTGRVSGVIDFGSVTIGDPAYDLASMMGTEGRGMGEAFVRRMAAFYPDLEAQLERANLYRKTFALQEALFGAEHGDEQAFAAGMAAYL
jgi:aminoglycoside 2''-phosphotransferase